MSSRYRFPFDGLISGGFDGERRALHCARLHLLSISGHGEVESVFEKSQMSSEFCGSVFREHRMNVLNSRYEKAGALDSLPATVPKLGGEIAHLRVPYTDS